MEGNALIGFGNRQLMLTRARQGEARDQRVWVRKARVSRGPRFQRSSFSFQVPREVAIVECLDVEALGVARPMPQLVGLEQPRSRERRLSKGAVAKPKKRRGQGKGGVDRART